MHVPQPSLVLHLLDPLAGLVEIPAELDDLRAERAHGAVLLRIVPGRHDDRAGDIFTLTRERNRLTVVAGGRRDDASPVDGGQARHEVEAAADLERAGGVVV